MNLKKLSVLASYILVALLIGNGCSDCGSQGPGKPGAAGELNQLKFIPADSPYVMASLKPAPKDVVEAFLKKFGPVYEQSIQTIQAELAKPTDMPAPGTGAAPVTNPIDPAKKALSAVLDEFKGNLSVEGLGRLGMRPDPMYAFYGIGLLPAARLELKDPALFTAMLDRVQAKSGLAIQQTKLGDQEYRSFTIKDESGEPDAKDLTFVLAILGNEAVATVGTATSLPEVLPVLFGQKKLERSLADSQELNRVMTDNGFSPYLLGYLDSKTIASIVMGDAQGLNGTVQASLKMEPLPITPVCKTEIYSIVDNFPRLLFGYDDFKADSMGGRAILEMKPELAKALSSLRAPVAGLSDQPAGPYLAALGLGLDVQKALDFAKAKSTGIVAAPYQCELLAELNSGASEMADKLAQPTIPPFVTSLKGFFVMVKEAQFAGKMPSAIKATGSLASDNPMVLVAMLQGLVPSLAKLKLEPNGTPTALPPMPDLPPMIQAPQVAIKGTTLALSIGEGMGAELPKIIEAKPADNPPLLLVSYDMAWLMEKMAEFQPGSEEEMKQVMGMNKAISQMMGLASYCLLVSERGLVLKYHLNIK